MEFPKHYKKSEIWNIKKEDKLLKRILKISVIVVLVVLTITLLAVFAYLKIRIYIANQNAEKIEIIDKIGQVNNNISLNTNKLDSSITNLSIASSIQHNQTTTNNNKLIGYLTIPDILLENAPIQEGTELTTLSQAIGHFTSTSMYQGNVGLASHNSGGQSDYFKNLKNIKIGSKIYYQTQYGNKSYIVVTKETIEETDLTYLKPTNDNRITLITCVKGQKEKRLCVQAIEDTSKI